ncbi:MAG TPA: thioesterase family protein [Chloroflexota bacterium]|nr:thioesterase family protein [Chloroflexota bacterium]
MSSCTKLRVRYAETDQMGFAHHANYLIWFEAARTEFLRSSGCAYTEFEAQGVVMPVREASCRFRTPAHYDELLEISCSVTRLAPTRLELAYEVRRDDTLVAEGATVQAFLGPEGRPINLEKRSPHLWAVLTKLAEEKGAPGNGQRNS